MKLMLTVLLVFGFGVTRAHADYSIEIIPPLGYSLDDSEVIITTNTTEIPFTVGILLGVTYDFPRRFQVGEVETGLRVGAIGGFTHLNTITYDTATTDSSVAYMSLPVMAYGEVWTERGLFAGLGAGIHSAMVRTVAGSAVDSETDLGFAGLYRVGYQTAVRQDIDLRIGAWVNWLQFPAAQSDGDDLNFFALAITAGVAFRL